MPTITVKAQALDFVEKAFKRIESSDVKHSLYVANFIQVKDNPKLEELGLDPIESLTGAECNILIVLPKEDIVLLEAISEFVTQFYNAKIQ